MPSEVIVAMVVDVIVVGLRVVGVVLVRSRMVVVIHVVGVVVVLVGVESEGCAVVVRYLLPRRGHCSCLWVCVSVVVCQMEVVL